MDAAAIEDITERADLGKGTFYRHFRDKYDLMLSLVENAVDHLLEHVNQVEQQPEDLEEALEHLLVAHSTFFGDNSEEFILLFQGRVLLKLQRESAEELEQPYVRYLEAIENYLSPYVSKRIDPVKVRRLACAVAGFVFGFLSFAMIGLTSEEIETSFKPLRRAFVAGLSTFLGR
ncbi:MAG: TetR/AcrR family transcriptional regulator [Phycisphaerae bacterium]|nr:TetR/AcrR family transcriptional regulator [Phycisphaerae bacterium]